MGWTASSQPTEMVLQQLGNIVALKNRYLPSHFAFQKCLNKFGITPDTSLISFVPKEFSFVSDLSTSMKNDWSEVWKRWRTIEIEVIGRSTDGKIKLSKNVVFVEGKAVDVKHFQHFHPGGNSLKWYWNVDVTEVLKRYEHAKSTYDIIKSFDQDGDFDGFVDWSQPLYGQVGSLGKNYCTWVEAPVLRPMRLFSSEWMEMQTKTKIHDVIIFWVPISIWLLTFSWEWREANGFDIRENIIHFALLVILGMMKWTLFEYMLHRFIFHSGPPQSSSVMITIHFLMHGLHHKVPFDGERLLFPILPACGIATTLYMFYTLYMPTWMSMAVMSGTVLGYVVYDMIHHYLHYGSPSPRTYLHFMKRYHNQHHFSDSTKGFGISSNLWDSVFSSAIHMRKLKFDLRWD